MRLLFLFLILAIGCTSKEKNLRARLKEIPIIIDSLNNKHDEIVSRYKIVAPGWDSKTYVDSTFHQAQILEGINQNIKKLGMERDSIEEILKVLNYSKFYSLFEYRKTAVQPVA